MTLRDIADALLTVGVPVFHYKPSAIGQIYRWAEDGDGALWADGMRRNNFGTMDYFK